MALLGTGVGEKGRPVLHFSRPLDQSLSHPVRLGPACGHCLWPQEHSWKPLPTGGSPRGCPNPWGRSNIFQAGGHMYEVRVPQRLGAGPSHSHTCCLLVRRPSALLSYQEWKGAHGERGFEAV